MKIHVALKIARQYEGEYVFIQALKGFVDRVNLSNFLKTYQYSPTEKINGIECIVEPGVVEVEVNDFDDFFGQYRVASGVQTTATPEKPVEWKNYNNLPVAKVTNDAFPRLLNPEILEWTEVGDGKREGRGLTWVEQSDPLVSLDSETFVPTKYYGELRLAQACNKGRYGPVMVQPSQEGDFYAKEED